MAEDALGGLDWDLPAPTIAIVRATTADTDGFGHVNNAVYLGWCERAAWHHSDLGGQTVAECRRIGLGMVVRTTTADYLGACHAGDEIAVSTWVIANDGRLRCQRHYQAIRLADRKTVLRAESQFVCCNLATGRPTRMPPAFLAAYRVLDPVAKALAAA